MSLLVTGLVLLAAFFHAAWNALLRSSADRKWGMLVFNITLPIFTLPFILTLPLPPAATWPYILFSSVCISGYTIFLVKAYEYGELTHAYPLMRSIAPLLVTLGAFLTSGEVPEPYHLLGIGLVSCGIFALAEMKHHVHRKTFFYAMLTGCFIASGTVTDGLGIRHGADVFAYTSWRSILCTLILIGYYWRDYKTLRFNVKNREAHKAAGAAVISFFGSAVIIWAMKSNPIGIVASLRETSVLFAFLIGVVLLKEQPTWQRGCACLIMTAGLILLKV